MDASASALGPQLDNSDEEEQQECLQMLPTSSSFSASGGSQARAAGQGPAPGPARLGLHFAGGTGACTRPLSWRDGTFSDWFVQVGEKKYYLHAFLLARASLFFESHMSVAARAEVDTGIAAPRGSDLTEVLPHSCHSAFEDALDFIYSENQVGFEAPASKALLLLKIADILGIGGLFEAMGRRIEVAFAETAPLLLEQYCQFHIPGTDDGAALRRIREGSVELIVQKFQPFLANPDMRKAMLRLPVQVLVEILESDELLASSEDVVLDFVLERLQLPPGEVVSQGDCAATVSGSDKGGEAPAATGGRAAGAAGSANGDAACCTDGNELLWHTVRWAHLSSATFTKAIAIGQRLLRPEAATHALAARVALLDLMGSDFSPTDLPPTRHSILPPGMLPPTSTEIDFCFHYRPDQYNCGDPLRSQPKRIGDLVLRVLVFPAGTDTGVARGSLSVFLEAVPQPHWPRDWEFTNIRYAIACLRWPSGSGNETWARDPAKRKSDLWTFKANRLDRGWHDFLAPGEISRYTGPDGFVCIRGSLDNECLGRAFLLAPSEHRGLPTQGSDVTGSSGSRRTWAPRTVPAPMGTD